MSLFRLDVSRRLGSYEARNWGKSLTHTPANPLGFIERLFTKALNLKISLRSSASFRSRIAEPRRNVAFGLQPIKRCIERPNRDRFFGTFLNLLENSYSVRVASQTKYGH